MSEITKSAALNTEKTDFATKYEQLNYFNRESEYLDRQSEIQAKKSGQKRREVLQKFEGATRETDFMCDETKLRFIATGIYLFLFTIFATVCAIISCSMIII